MTWPGWRRLLAEVRPQGKAALFEEMACRQCGQRLHRLLVASSLRTARKGDAFLALQTVPFFCTIPLYRVVLQAAEAAEAARRTWCVRKGQAASQRRQALFTSKKAARLFLAFSRVQRLGPPQAAAVDMGIFVDPAIKQAVRGSLSLALRSLPLAFHRLPLAFPFLPLTFRHLQQLQEATVHASTDYRGMPGKAKQKTNKNGLTHLGIVLLDRLTSELCVNAQVRKQPPTTDPLAEGFGEREPPSGGERPTKETARRGGSDRVAASLWCRDRGLCSSAQEGSLPLP